MFAATNKFGIACVYMELEPDNEQTDYSDKAHKIVTNN